ncbi:helix-turn-helix domain-containing protein [Polaromonas sp. LjRoot131]|uniref:helix-turn-helix domain-containing protein n=1 Tax=Polaromonas sp. LjRoot131 TaxID=3342262 RepID=UPI003ECED61D
MQRKKREFPEDLRRRLGAAIAERRKLGKLTQDELAGLVEVDAETVSRFERGISMPSLERLWVIAEALDVGMSDLLVATSTLPNDQARRLTAIMDGLAIADQRLLMDFAQLLQKRQVGDLPSSRRKQE